MTDTTPSAASLAAVCLLLAGCGGGEAEEDGLSGRVRIDGSSTVYPVTQAVAEEFQAAHRGVRVTVGVSGTGGGFQKFCRGEIDLADASRPMADVERERCEEAGVEHVEVPVAYDGITVVVNPENDWAQCLTVEELRRMWRAESDVQRWSQVRDGFPDRKLALYGPDTDSGTFDYFTDAVLGEGGNSRSGYTASADDNVLVRGVSGDPDALAYFGFAYYVENRERVRAVAVDDGSGCVDPTRETIESGEYSPLSRPVFVYVRRSSLQRPEIEAFVRFYLEQAADLVPQVGYVPMAAARYDSLLSELPAPGSGSGDETGEDAAG